MSRPTTTPDWMEGKTPPDTNITEPSAEKKALGFLPGEKPPADYFNWLLWIKNKWIKFLDEKVNVEHDDSGYHKTVKLGTTPSTPNIKIAPTATEQLTVSDNTDADLVKMIIKSALLTLSGDLQIDSGENTLSFYSFSDATWITRNATTTDGVTWYPVTSGGTNNAWALEINDTNRYIAFRQRAYSLPASWTSWSFNSFPLDWSQYWETGEDVNAFFDFLKTNRLTLLGSANKPYFINSSGSADIVVADALGLGLRVYASGTAPKRGFLQLGTGKAGLLTYASESVTYIVKNATFDGVNFSTVDATTPSFGLIFSDTDSAVEIVSRPAGAGSWTTWPSKTYPLNTSGDSVHYGKKTIERSSGTDEVIVTKIASDTQNRHTVDANGKQEWGAGGTSARDTNLYRNAADELKTDDKFTSALGFLAGSGYFYEQPDVAGGTANDGKFLGGNGGFMWFDGTLADGASVVLDSGLDWRDRWIYVVGFLLQETDATPYIPGGGSDNFIRGFINGDGAGGLTTEFFATTFFYSEAGPTATYQPGGQLNIDSRDVYIYASNANGDLSLNNLSVNLDLAYGLLVIFSNDQGHV